MPRSLRNGGAGEAVKKMATMFRAGHSPPCITARRGGRAIKKISRSSADREAGVVFRWMLKENPLGAVETVARRIPRCRLANHRPSHRRSGETPAPRGRRQRRAVARNNPRVVSEEGRRLREKELLHPRSCDVGGVSAGSLCRILVSLSSTPKRPRLKSPA
jgi:hypothetical protein